MVAIIPAPLKAVGTDLASTTQDVISVVSHGSRALSKVTQAWGVTADNYLTSAQDKAEADLTHKREEQIVQSKERREALVNRIVSLGERENKIRSKSEGHNALVDAAHALLDGKKPELSIAAE